MDFQAVTYILEAVEEIDDYYPLLKDQDKINHVIVRHSIDALNQIFTTYKNEHYHDYNAD